MHIAVTDDHTFEIHPGPFQHVELRMACPAIRMGRNGHACPPLCLSRRLKHVCLPCGQLIARTVGHRFVVAHQFPDQTGPHAIRSLCDLPHEIIRYLIDRCGAQPSRIRAFLVEGDSAHDLHAGREPILPPSGGCPTSGYPDCPNEAKPRR